VVQHRALAVRAEQQAISDAKRTLRAIQREKLGYPDWNEK
jgi:hypothetical protein